MNIELWQHLCNIVIITTRNNLVRQNVSHISVLCIELDFEERKAGNGIFKLVAPPLALIIASMRCGILTTNFSRKHNGIFSHSAFNLPSSSCPLLNFSFVATCLARCLAMIEYCRGGAGGARGYSPRRSMLAPRRKVKSVFSEIFGIYSTLKTIF